MKLNSHVAAYTMFALAVVAVYWIGSAAASAYGLHTHQASPARPPWVQANGTVDVNKMPDCIPALGATGETLRDSNGRTVCIPKLDLVGPPSQSVQPDLKSPGEISRTVHSDGREEVVVEKAKRHDQ